MKLLLVILFCNLFYLYSVENIYAHDSTIAEKIESTYNDNFSQNENIVKITSNLKSGWTLFKKWFRNLPGMKHYNNFVDSDKSYKEIINDIVKEYIPHLHKSDAGTNLLKKINTKGKEYNV
jgi:hypothetical protein